MTTIIPGRGMATVATSANALSPSGPVRENPKLKLVLKELEEAALLGCASSTMLLPSYGIKYEAWSFSHQTGLAKEINISDTKPGAKIQGHIAINISGHARGGHAELLTALALRQLRDAHAIDLGPKTPANDALFSKLLEAAKQAGPGSVTLKVEGLTAPIVLSDADISAFGRTPRGEEAGNDVLKRNYALSNTYDIRVILPDGQQLEMANIKPATPNYAVMIPFEFPAMTGTTTVQAYPTKSAKAAGYREARQYELHIGSQNFFNEEKAIIVAEKYMDAHPEVRWAARAADPGSSAAAANEEADLAAKHVNPAPWPYADTVL